MIVSFNDKTNLDYGLTFVHKEIGPAVPRLKYAEVPFADGKLDITNSYDKDVRFDNRTIKIDFEIIEDRTIWNSVMESLRKDIEGKKISVAFSDDSEWFWKGRANVSSITDNGYTASISVTIDAFPYKMNILSKTVSYTAPSSSTYSQTTVTFTENRIELESVYMEFSLDNTLASVRMRNNSDYSERYIMSSMVSGPTELIETGNIVLKGGTYTVKTFIGARLAADMYLNYREVAL